QAADRREARDRVIVRLVQLRCHQERVRHHQKRASVRIRARYSLRTDHRTGAGTVLDHEGRALRLAICSASWRATTSTPPPAGSGTMIRVVPVWARAPTGESAATTRATAAAVHRRCECFTIGLNSASRRA